MLSDLKSKAGAKGIDAKKLAGIVVDDEAAKQTGSWGHSASTGIYVGSGYLHDNNENKGKKSVRFAPKFEKAGKYEVFFHFSTASNRATNVPVVVKSADGEKTVKVDQKKSFGEKGQSLGTFTFEAGESGHVEIRTEGTDGHVIADAVRFVLAK